MLDFQTVNIYKAPKADLMIAPPPLSALYAHAFVFAVIVLTYIVHM